MAAHITRLVKLPSKAGFYAGDIDLIGLHDVQGLNGKKTPPPESSVMEKHFGKIKYIRYSGKQSG